MAYPKALQPLRWFLTAHERASITTALREMFGDKDNQQVGATFITREYIEYLGIKIKKILLARKLKSICFKISR